MFSIARRVSAAAGSTILSSVRIISTAIAMSAIGAASVAMAGGIAIVETQVVDNGDGDGFADTRETVALILTVHNSSGADQTELTAEIVSRRPDLACDSSSVLEIGDLSAGETRTLDEPFVFVVGDVDRAALGLGPLDELSVVFDVRFEATSGSLDAQPSTIRLDLDLDVAGGSGSTTFFESFEEASLGAFSVQNLDAGRNNLEASDGFRCQYNDPDWVHSNNLGAEDCHVGTSALQADTTWWGISGPGISPGGGRAFSGFHAMFFGIDMGFPLNWTTPLASLEAAMITEPLNLGWDSTPTLSFMHQISLVDARTFKKVPGQSSDRGIVMVQLADEAGAPVGDWIKIHPYRNVYDQQGITSSFYCTFDPVDDGSTEDDFFDPSDPARRFGPSSTCFPEWSFVNLGETSSPYAATNLGHAEGPALAGMWGIGSWVESRFDLGRFRGRRIRLRFLTSTMRVLHFDDWQDFRPMNPISGDDGWWIDDVTVSGVLAQPAQVTLDLRGNEELPGLPVEADRDIDAVCDLADNCPSVTNPGQLDGDGDGSGTGCDCNDALGTVFPGASEVNDGLDNQCPGDAGHGLIDEVTGTTGFHNAENRDEYSWPAQLGATRYKVARAPSADFSLGCIVRNVTYETSFNDAQQPATGVVYFYMARSAYPNQGSWGADSTGRERTVPCD